MQEVITARLRLTSAFPIIIGSQWPNAYLSTNKEAHRPIGRGKVPASFVFAPSPTYEMINCRGSKTDANRFRHGRSLVRFRECPRSRVLRHSRSTTIG